MTETEKLRIDVVSDVVCPWCYLGQKRLDDAIAASGVAVSVAWRPYQLDPTIPSEGLDRKAYMQAKFGDMERLHQAHLRLKEMGTAVGIDYDFDAIAVSPNTLDAHRTIRWAGGQGQDVQNKLVRQLFRLYFELGKDVGDRSVLADAAQQVGMDRAVVETLLSGDADREAVLEEASTASRMGVTGVPCFLFEEKYAVMGAQETSVLVDAIRQIAAAKQRGEPNA